MNCRMRRPVRALLHLQLVDSSTRSNFGLAQVARPKRELPVQNKTGRRKEFGTTGPELPVTSPSDVSHPRRCSQYTLKKQVVHVLKLGDLSRHDPFAVRLIVTTRLKHALRGHVR
jgi:hypothetical protein